MDDNLQTLGGSDDGVSVHTGFPNPALSGRSRGAPLALDLNQLLVQRPASTYLFRISGHSWADQGVYDGDVAVVDRALAAQANDLVVSWQASGFTLCRRQRLANGDEALGVVTAIIHRYSR